MKRFSIFHPLWMSFFSKDLFRDIAQSWRGINLLYLFLLVALCSLIFTFKLHLGIREMVKEELPAIVTQVPTLTIKDGKLSTEEAKPYVIEDPESKELIAIIDTTQDDPPSDLSGARAFATQTEVVIQKSSVEKRSFQFSEIKDFVLTQEKLNHWLDLLLTWGALVAFPFILIGLFIYRFFQMLLLSIITLIASKILKVSMEYPTVLRLTTIAMTPALILGAIVSLFSVTIPYSGWAFLILVTAYIFFIVSSLRINGETSTTPPPLVQ